MRKLTTKNGKYNMGLLDYFKNGMQSMQNQPQMYDPHANARALMGGTSMNAQPQSLIGNTPQTEATNPTNVTPTTTLPAQLPTEQNPLMNPGVQTTEYQQPIGPNYNGNLPFGSAPQQGLINPTGENVNLGQTSETYGSGYAGTPTSTYQPNLDPSGSFPIDTMMGRPDYGVAENPNDRPILEEDDTDYAATTNGYKAPSDILGTAFDPRLSEEERLLREQAKANIPWYLGGTGGK